MSTEQETEEQTKPWGTLAQHGQLIFSQDPTLIFKPWRGKEERELSEYLQQNAEKLEGGRACKRVSLILQYMCVQFGEHIFWQADGAGGFVEKMSEAERDLTISQAYEADVLCAYLLLRIRAIGPEAVLDVPSPFAKDRIIKWHGNLGTIELVGGQSVDDATWTHKGETPTLIRGKEITEFVMAPARWSVSEALRLDGNMGSLTMKTIAGSVHMLPEFNADHPIQLVEQDLDDMTKRNISLFENALNREQSGPDLSIEVYDPDAKKTFVASLPWLNTDFLAISSQS